MNECYEERKGRGDGDGEVRSLVLMELQASFVARQQSLTLVTLARDLDIHLQTFPLLSSFTFRVLVAKQPIYIRG